MYDNGNLSYEGGQTHLFCTQVERKKEKFQAESWV